MSIRVLRDAITVVRLSWVVSLAGAWMVGWALAGACPAARPSTPASQGKSQAVKALENAGLKSDDASLLAYLASGSDAVGPTATSVRQPARAPSPAPCRTNGVMPQLREACSAAVRRPACRQAGSSRSP